MAKLSEGAADIVKIGAVALGSQFRNPRTQRAVVQTGELLAEAFKKGVSFLDDREPKIVKRITARRKR